jgi:hypothetical protein
VGSHFQAKVDLGTCRTTVQNIGPVTFVIAHVLGHLSLMHGQAEKDGDCAEGGAGEQAEQREEAKAATENKKNKQKKQSEYIEHSAVIWAFWFGRESVLFIGTQFSILYTSMYKLLVRYDACNVSTLVAKLMSRERECCLLVLNLVSSTLSCIRQPRPLFRLHFRAGHAVHP